MKQMVKWVVGSVCTWIEDASDYDFPNVDAYFADLAPCGRAGR